MLSLLFLLITCSSVFYYTYKTLWFHAISMFETFKSKQLSIPLTPMGSSFNLAPQLYKSHSSQFFQTLLEYDTQLDQNKVVPLLKSIARFVFSLSITSTVLIIEFILLQSFNKDESEVGELELVVWEIGVYSLIVVLGLVQPFIITFLILNKFFKSKALNKNSIKLGGSLGTVSVWLLFILKFDRFTDFKEINFDDVNYSSKFLYKLATIGITLISILNGIGSFSTAYYYLYKALIAKDEMLSQDDESIRQRLFELRKTYANTENLINSKNIEFDAKLALNQGQLQKRTNIQPKGSFLDLSSYFRKDDEGDELQNEIKSLTLIKNDIYLKIQKYDNYLVSSSKIQTKQQFFIQSVQKLLAVYCFFKISQVVIVKVISIIRYYNNKDTINTSDSDPLVITISKLVQIFITVQDEDFLINQLSFIVSGGLFICSFNGVFMTLTHLYKFIPIDLSEFSKDSKRKNKSVSVIKNLFVSELLGIYVLATMFILRSNLTRSFSSKLNYLFNLNNKNHGRFDFEVIDNWFDKVFLLSVVITATGIKIGEILTIDEGFESHELLNKVV